MLRRRNMALLAGPSVLLVGSFVLVPMLVTAVQSLRSDGQWSLGNFLVLGETPYLPAILTTLWIAVSTTAVTMLLVVPACAFFAARGRVWSNAFLVVVAISFTLSVLTRTLAWQVLLAFNGVVNDMLMALGLVADPIHLLYTPWAVLIAMVQVMLPYAAMLIFTGMRRVDRSIVFAARTLGAGALHTFRHAYWPQIRGSVIMSVVVVFSISAGTFVMPTVLGGPSNIMLGQLMNSALVSDPVNGVGRASAMGVLLAGALIVALLAGLQLMGGRKGVKGSVMGL
ncbi:MAG: ABC transporter permease [Protaetiibacter sp.]